MGNNKKKGGMNAAPAPAAADKHAGALADAKKVEAKVVAARAAEAPVKPAKMQDVPDSEEDDDMDMEQYYDGEGMEDDEDDDDDGLDEETLFWGVTLKPDTKESIVMDRNETLVLSMVSLTPELNDKAGRTCLQIAINDEEFTLAVLLAGKAESVPLNLTLSNGDQVELWVTGKNAACVTGNLSVQFDPEDISQYYGGMDDELDEDSDDEPDEAEVPPPKPAAKVEEVDSDDDAEADGSEESEEEEEELEEEPIPSKKPMPSSKGATPAKKRGGNSAASTPGGSHKKSKHKH
ncbi:FK506-binding protein 4 [Porphyridium purpureum]|uniref:FK506-binding protein 4 n=1 Tax=Porphyridium purpureum TaxID=35688 RepID=A0A5J4YZ37_PORPP|nr:FK506-binding protein 4 [Porphyridium purpureum]|eukprot:POR7185..scf209_3